MRLFKNGSQRTAKCGKNKNVAHEAIAESVTDDLTSVINNWTDSRQHGIYLFWLLMQRNSGNFSQYIYLYFFQFQIVSLSYPFEGN